MITSIITIDSVYSFTPNYDTSFAILDEFILQNNNIKADTQGFLRKIQVGYNRIQAVSTIKGTKADLEANMFPMLTYSLPVTVTFDRNILTKTISYMTCVIEGMRLLQEFDNGNEQEYEIILTEVLS